MDKQRHLIANFGIKQQLFSNCCNSNEPWWKEAPMKSSVTAPFFSDCVTRQTNFIPFSGNGHATLNTPVVVWSLKFSIVGPGQYLDGWPPGNTRCFWHFDQFCNDYSCYKRKRKSYCKIKTTLQFIVSYQWEKFKAQIYSKCWAFYNQYVHSYVLTRWK